MKVGIIGGGAAGLGAAYELTLGGHTAEVFERAPFLGGQASTFLVGGTPVERGYHHLFRSDTAMTGLMEELGLGGRLRWIDSNVGYFFNSPKWGDRIWPFTTPLDLLRFRPLPLLDRMRLGMATLRLQRRKEWHSLESQTASEWMRRHVGERAHQVVFEPMLRGKFGSYYDQVSMAWLWNKFALRTASRGKGLRGMWREQLGYPEGSFGEVFDTMARRVEQGGGRVHTSSAVEQVVVEEGRAVGLEVKRGDGKAGLLHYDAVIATVPSFILPRLVPLLPQDYQRRLTDAVYLAAVLVVLVLDRPLTSTYWLYVGDRSIPFLGVIEHTNFMPPEMYGGNHIVYLANYLGKDDPLYGLSREELYQQYLGHLKRLNAAFDESWVREYHYHREEAAQPVVTQGYQERMPDHHTPIRGLYLANTTQVYPEDRGTNYSVRMGRRVARMAMDEEGKTWPS
jgi:protoporphyrinogen oxidase